MYPVAVIAVLAAVVALAALTDTGTGGDGEHLGGDYPAFYGAGSLVLDGDWDSLYDDAAQQEAQAGLVDDEGGFLYFAYPPPVAAVYGPLAALDYRWSYLLHTALMGLALWGAVRTARPMIPFVAAHPTAVFAGLLLIYPLYRAVTGGQNAALTLLLVVAAARFHEEERPLAAGALVGLLLYKPQFGVVFLALLIVRRSWRALAAAGGVAAVMWAVSAMFLGVGWTADWWDQATRFSEIDAGVNSGNLVSIPGALEHIAGGAGAVLGWAIGLGLAAALVVIWWLRPAAGLAAAYALTVAVAVLAAPRTLFYESGLVVFAAGLALVKSPRKGRLLAVVGAASWLQPISGPLGSLPLTVMATGVTLWAGRELFVPRRTPARNGRMPAVGAE